MPATATPSTTEPTEGLLPPVSAVVDSVLPPSLIDVLPDDERLIAEKVGTAIYINATARGLGSHEGIQLIRKIEFIAAEALDWGAVFASELVKRRREHEAEAKAAAKKK